MLGFLFQKVVCFYKRYSDSGVSCGYCEVFNNRIFYKNPLVPPSESLMSKRKRNFIYHFLVKNKPHEKIDLLITASVNIYKRKKVF